MKAVILAAGRGTRLEPLTADIPKALVEVGGVTLLDRMLDRLDEVGVQRVFVVTGHGHDRVAAHLEASDRPLAKKARTVFNKHYADWGNFYSLFCAQDVIWDSEFIALDGDVLLGPEILPRLLEADGQLVLAVDRAARLGKEEMKAQIEDGKVVKLNKRMRPKHADGEFIGVERLSASVVPMVFEELRDMAEGDEQDEYYERAFERLMGEPGIDVTYADVSGCAWCEIDDAADLERAHAIAESGAV